MPDIIREYGQAFRGDWSPMTIDGRAVRTDMEEVARWVEEPDQYPGDEVARDRLGVCPMGKGHWTVHCGPDYCGAGDD